jgi:hypothetical protein
MNSKTMIKRKFRLGWSDYQMLMLLELGAGPASFMRVVEETGGSTSGIWNAAGLLLGEDLIGKRVEGRRTIFFLTSTGAVKLAEVLA